MTGLLASKESGSAVLYNPLNPESGAGLARQPQNVERNTTRIRNVPPGLKMPMRIDVSQIGGGGKIEAKSDVALLRAVNALGGLR